MESDIVSRLRAVLHNDRSVELMNLEAANEIERLRTHLELWQSKLQSDFLRVWVDARHRVETLTAERDEARKEICERVSKTIWTPQFALMSKTQYAEERGWDCFKGASDGE